MRVSSNIIADVLDFCKKELTDIYGTDEAASLTRILFEEYCGLNRTDLAFKKHECISESELLLVYDAVKLLKQHHPIQYIIGKSEFYGLNFFVNPAVLIPRPETEELVAQILKEKLVSNAVNPLRILDIGTGSGCIAITLKSTISNSTVTAIDISSDALKTAVENATQNNAAVNFERIDMLNTQLMADLGNFDIIVSNPPYVRESEKKQMQPNVTDHEPSVALFVSDDDPLIFYRAIFDFAASHLLSQGVLMVEINEYLGNETMALAELTGSLTAKLIKDLSGKDRFVHCIRTYPC
ncbi:MAG: peptide chain release factor N(5)-glutamine methyltransferase [Bacteroidota bacterium]